MVAQTVDLFPGFAELCNNWRNSGAGMAVLLVIEQAPGSGGGRFKCADQPLAEFCFKIRAQAIQPLKSISPCHSATLAAGTRRARLHEQQKTPAAARAFRIQPSLKTQMPAIA